MFFTKILFLEQDHRHPLSEEGKTIPNSTLYHQQESTPQTCRSFIAAATFICRSPCTGSRLKVRLPPLAVSFHWIGVTASWRVVADPKPSQMLTFLGVTELEAAAGGGAPPSGQKFHTWTYDRSTNLRLPWGMCTRCTQIGDF